jgi:hypothetical protein
MDVEQARRLALALPEATEQPHFEVSSFRVRGKIFATVPPAGATLRIFVDEATTRALVAQDPAVHAELWWGKRLSGVEVRLAGADPGEVAELLEEAYRRKAPKGVQARLDQAGGSSR